MHSEYDNVVLVDENDVAIGTIKKLEAHQKALLHRAFSVFVFNNKNELLLQKRNVAKYHSGGLWTNTCCGHPRPNEDTKSAAERRLFEEMGFKITITKKFDFIYQTEFDNGLAEHELDHVFFGVYDNNPKPDPLEVSDWKFVHIIDIMEDIKKFPQTYTFWFKICLDKINTLKYVTHSFQ